ncbi:hypothetical protein ABZ901_22710 [Actinacidiphila alni]|uniref:hypothetical protein n=1 Tax=Actinacidiphila alni TaxID=380248 RepID=UPI0033D9E240
MDPRQLVPYVRAVVGEGVASVVSAVVTVAVVLCIPVSVTDAGISTLIQLSVLAGFGLLWAIALLVGRAREVRSLAGAVPVPEPELLAGLSDDRRGNLRRGWIRSAVFTVVAIAASGAGLHAPWLGLMLPLMHAAMTVHVRRMVAWERRHSVVLWRPALSAVGREAARAAPFYTTPRSG